MADLSTKEARAIYRAGLARGITIGANEVLAQWERSMKLARGAAWDGTGPELTPKEEAAIDAAIEKTLKEEQIR